MIGLRFGFGKKFPSIRRGFAIPNILSLFPSEKLISARAVFSLDGTMRKLVRVRSVDANGSGGPEVDLNAGIDGWIDNSAATAALAASTNATPELRVTIAYDQFGEFHAYQTVVENQPRLLKNPVTNRWEIVFGNTNGQYGRYLNLSDPVVNNDASMFVIDRSRNDYSSGVNFDQGLFLRHFSSSSPGGIELSWRHSGASNFRWDYYDNTIMTTAGYALHWDSRPQLFWANKLAGEWRMNRYPDFANSGTLIGGFANDPTIYDSGTWGNVSGAVGSIFALCSITGKSLSETNSNAISDALRSYIIGAAPTRGITWNGDSMSRGYILGQENDPDRGIGIRLQSILGDDYLVKLKAREGDQITTMDANMTAYFDSTRESMANGHTCVLYGGYNDAFAAVSAATIYTRISTWISNRKSAGWDRVVVCTLPNPTSNAIIAALNPLIIENTGGADLVLNLETCATWTVESGNIQAVDGLHLTPNGCLAIASFAATLLS